MILKQKNDFKRSPDFTETRLIKAISLLLFSVLFSFSTMAQNIGVNATGAEPDASALLDLSSTDKGFLITRADTFDIPTPAFGLMTLSPKDSCLYMYGKHWINLGGVGYFCDESAG